MIYIHLHTYTYTSEYTCTHTYAYILHWLSEKSTSPLILHPMPSQACNAESTGPTARCGHTRCRTTEPPESHRKSPLVPCWMVNPNLHAYPWRRPVSSTRPCDQSRQPISPPSEGQPHYTDNQDQLYIHTHIHIYIYIYMYIYMSEVPGRGGCGSGEG